jgi:ABC-2 type transport system permease protein
MNAVGQYAELLKLQLRTMRTDIITISVIQVALTGGLVLGFGYIIPDISDISATYLVTGTATQSFVTIGLVMLPQFLSQAKADGRLDYMLTLPISREAYLLSQVTVVGVVALPGVAFAVLIGDWKYGLSLTPDPMMVPVMLLAVLSLAGVGVAMAVLIPQMQVTNAITQLIIFYVLFFSPVILPKEQLPAFLRHAADFMPPSYAADAVRATLTDLPGTHLGRSLIVMASFAVASLGLASTAVRRRG